MTDVVADHRRGAHDVLADATLHDGTPSITARSPLRFDGERGDPGVPPELGRDTEVVLAEVLGLTSAELGRLAAAGVIGSPRVPSSA